MVTSKRTYAKGHLPGLLFPGPHRHDKPQLTHTSAEDSPVIADLVHSPMGSLLFSLGSWCTQDFVCALQEWSLWFPQSCGSPVIKSCSPSKAGSLEVPSPFARYPVWEAWREAQNLHNSGRTSLVVLFSSSWVTYLVGVGLDFILFVPLLPSHCSFFFVFGCGVSFLGGFQHPPVDGYSTASYNFGALTGGDEHTSFCSAISNQTWMLSFLYFLLRQFFWSSFKFIAKLRGRYSYFLYIPCPRTCIASPIINISSLSGIFDGTD